MRIPSFLGLGLLLGASAFAQQQQGQLKARELFYTPVEEVKSKPAAEPKPAQAAKRQRPAPPAAKSGEASQGTRQQATTLPDGTRMQTASMTKVTGPPLALKYRLLKRSAEGRYDEVETDSVFRSGDGIRFTVESNDSGFLYIVQQGSSKKWNVLFPNAEIETGNNRVERNREYEIPSGNRQFTFVEEPGVERLFIVLTRRPEPDLEKLIYNLGEGGDAKPASLDGSETKPKMLMAGNKIDDTIINRLRGKVLARDLVLETVNDVAPVQTSSGFRKEKAAYVATQDRTPDARIVVDLNLKHQ